MKSLLRLTVLLSVATTGLRAQGWTGGLKGGFGQGGYTGKSEFVWSPTAMNIALSFSHALSDRVSIQPEISATQKVGQSAIGGSVLTFSAEDITLPVLLRVDYPRRTGLTPFLLAGPSLTIHASCSLQFVVAGVTSDLDCAQETVLSRLDLGVVAGGGVSRAFGHATVTAELRANLNMQSEAVPDGSGYGRGIGWAILVGARVPLKAGAFRGRTPKGLAAGSIRMELIGQDRGLNAPSVGDSTRVSLHTVDADVRSVLVTIALETGVSLIVAENVRGRVSVALSDTSAVAALRAVVAQTGLTMSRSTIKTKPTTWLVEALHVTSQRHTGGSGQ